MCFARFNPSEPGCNPDSGCGRCRCVPAAWRLTAGPSGYSCARYSGTHILRRNNPDFNLHQTKCSWETVPLDQSGAPGLADAWILGYDMRFTSVGAQLTDLIDGWGIVMPSFLDIFPTFLVAQWWPSNPPFRCLEPNEFYLADGRGNPCAGSFPTITIEPMWCRK